MDTLIHGGLQQIGLGVRDIHDIHAYYKKHFNFDMTMFNQESEVGVMSPYMEGRRWRRHVIFAMNFRGGGGTEIVQLTNRFPVGLEEEVSLGNVGILASHIRCKHLRALRYTLLSKGYEVSVPVLSPDKQLRCYVRDPEYNWIGLIETDKGWASSPHRKNLVGYPGGVCGALIGVTDMDKAIAFYSTVCNCDTVVYDVEGTFPDFDIIQNNQKVRRVLLTSNKKNAGVFAHLLQHTSIELVQALEHPVSHLYKGRCWGDPGYTHLGFNIRGSKAFKEHCQSLGYTCTIDSDFDFSAEHHISGCFLYVEDPDGTLMEFVEVYKIPIIKKYNIMLDLQKRKMGVPLSNHVFTILKLTTNAREYTK